MRNVISCNTRDGVVRFFDIPEYFLLRYTDEINAWAANLRKIGVVKSFVLREGYLSDLSPDPEHGAVLLQVKLVCKPWARGVEIKPLRWVDRELIAAHCAKMQGAGIPARARLVEPERPWVPFMPSKVTEAN